MIEFLTRFLRVTSQSILNDKTFTDCVKPVVVRHEVFHSKKEFQRQFGKIIELYVQKRDFLKGLFKDDPEILEVLSEPQYPQDDEYEIFIKLVQMIDTNINFIHPQDLNS